MSDSTGHDAGLKRFEDGRGAALPRAILAVAVFYLAGMLLNGEALHESAGRRRFGIWQQAWTAGTRPLAWAARATRVGRFRAWADRLMPE